MNGGLHGDMVRTLNNALAQAVQATAAVEKERDDYEEYWEKRRKYELLMKKLDSDTPLFQIPPEVLMASFGDWCSTALGAVQANDR